MWALIGLPQLAVLTLQGLDPVTIDRRLHRPRPLIPLDLPRPLPQRLRHKPILGVIELMVAH